MKKFQKEIIGTNLLIIAIFILLSVLIKLFYSFQTVDYTEYYVGVGNYIAEKLTLIIGSICSISITYIIGLFGFMYIAGKYENKKKYTLFSLYIFIQSIWISVVLVWVGTIFEADLPLLQDFSGAAAIVLQRMFISNFKYFAPIVLFTFALISNMIYFEFSFNHILVTTWKYIKDITELIINKISRRKNIINIEEPVITDTKVTEEETIEQHNEEEISTSDIPQELASELSDNETLLEKSKTNFKELDDIDIKDEIFENEVDIDLEDERKSKYFNYSLPKSSLLSSPIETGQRYSEAELHEKSEELIYALETFGVKGKVRRINQGPVITLFEIEPDEGVRVNKFVNLSDDLSRVMKASKVRVIAPIPGTRFVGIEIPNESPAMVYIKSIINSEIYTDFRSKLTLALGKTTSGKTFCYELDKMPHLLVAGATGSGKSVCINSIIASILYKAKPDEVKFILIDPKKVELSSYNILKNYHLISAPNLDEDVITKTENSTGILQSAITEMERRFELFSETKVRNIQEYNAKLNNNSNLEILPYIIIIIDELADLMMTSGRAIEDPITRLAQKARAVGIHLIVATQRPSVNVITGLIKSNFPARIAFQVSSKVDSRTIIDQNGAETLLGNGDMLFLPPGSSVPIRLHGAFISLKEIETILKHISEQPTPEKVFLPELITNNENKEFELEDRDELLMEAAKLVIQHQQASVSLLQRKFRIGYSRAGRIIDELESLGIVSGHSGSKARDVLVDESYLDNLIK